MARKGVVFMVTQTASSRPATRRREQPTPDAGPAENTAWLARLVVGVRITAIASVGLLLRWGPPWVREHVLATSIILLAAGAYSVILLVRPGLEMRRAPGTWFVTTVDTTVTLLIIALTGGASSPAVTILPLLVVSVAIRSRFTISVGHAVVVAGAYAAIALSSSTSDGDFEPPLEAAWWPPYLVMTTVLAAALSLSAQREEHSKLLALSTAEAERASAEEERDLRARLLESYRNQQDGLRVLLHEFRTPLVSLEALGLALQDETAPMSAENQSLTIQLANGHIRHLTEMMEALGDVAVSWRPTFSVGPVRGVDVRELVLGAGDAVGLHAPRLNVVVQGELRDVSVNAQGLRRVITNLLENAARHGRGKPVDVVCSADQHELVVSVLDRGPGVAPESLGTLTSKFVSLGDQRGTAGLGLWIVQQILEASGGTLHFSEREGGGLIATVRLPRDVAPQR